MPGSKGGELCEFRGGGIALQKNAESGLNFLLRRGPYYFNSRGKVFTEVQNEPVVEQGQRLQWRGGKSTHGREPGRPGGTMARKDLDDDRVIIERRSGSSIRGR